MPPLPQYSPTEQIGINAASTIFSRFGWIFRHQPVADMGIDAHVEIVGADGATGKLFALQIKCGPSYFRRDGNGDVIFTFKDKHMNYWSGHSLPVFLVLHNPEDNETLWYQLSRENAERRENGWRVTVPSANQLNAEATSAFLDAVKFSNEIDKRRQEMLLHKPILDALDSGAPVFLETEDWCNKSLKRGKFKFILGADEASETIEWNFYYAGMSLETALHSFFPWAKFSVDEDYYEAHREDETCFMDDWEGDDSGADASRCPEVLYPYENSCGEIDLYRLCVFLNPFGKAYLLTETYMLTGELEST